MEARLRTPLLVLFAVGLALSITLAETVLAVLVVRWVVRLARGRVRPAARWPLGWPFLAFAAVSLAAAAASARPGESLLTAAKGFALVPTFYVLVDALPDGAAARRFFGLLATLLAGVATVGIAQVAFCGGLAPLAPYVGRVATKCHRAHGFYSIYMTLAGVLNLALLAGLPALLPAGERGAPARPAGRAPIVLWLLTAIGFALTYVRGAWVGFFAGVGVLLALLRRGRVVLGAGFLVLVIALLLVPGVRRRAESIADPADPTAYDRVLMWKSGAAMARDHWLLGVGPGQVKHVLPAYAQPEAKSKSRSHLHNTPLQILVERGVTGLVAWAAIFVVFFLRCRRMLAGLASGEDRRLTVGAVAAVAGFLVGGLTEYNFGDSEVALVAYVVMALPFAAASSSQNVA
ncbi:MAG: O-antigen ligase family protein [Candidatus Rokubacteria bacterium]|nr:O-antigen ligase family protein [Candidatus Rokubacteria bacterium]